MTRSLRAGVIAISAIAIAIGLSGCGSGTKSSPSTSKQTSATSSAASGTPAPSTSAQAAGPNKTIVDYIKENNINETPVHKGDAAAWEDAGSRTPEWAYAAIVSTDPALAQDPPTIIALVSKLTGNADPQKILEFAPGEIKNLPGYDGAPDGSPSNLGGFDATQIGGTYIKNGAKHAIAQKTVVIPGQDGLYVLQLNADGTEDQMGALMEATGVIDEQTTITP
jgi:hypothetical protein